VRVLIDLDERRIECDVAHAAPATTLTDLVEAAGGPRLAPDETVFVNEAEVRGSTPVSELIFLEGSRISRAPWQIPQRVRGWSVTLAGGQRADALNALADPNTASTEDTEVVVKESKLGTFKIPPNENVAEVDFAGLRRIFVNNRLDVFLIFKANQLEFWERGEIHFGFFTMTVQSSFLHP